MMMMMMMRRRRRRIFACRQVYQQSANADRTRATATAPHVQLDRRAIAYTELNAECDQQAAIIVDW